MTEVTERYLNRIAQDWIAYFTSPEDLRDKDDNLFNPFCMVDLLVREMSFYAWELILLILELDVEGKTLDLLSASTLEDFISLHGKDWIEDIEGQARLNPRFRSLLAGVRQFSAEQEVWDRVIAARGDARPF